MKFFYCASCKNSDGFPMTGLCHYCENYSQFELSEFVSEKTFKSNSRTHEFLLLVVVTLVVVSFVMVMMFPM